METIWIIVGVAVIALVLVDAVATTLSTASRAGPLTRLTSGAMWQLALLIHQRRPRHRLLAAMGPLLLLLGLVQWVALLWFGWYAIFTSDPSAVISSTTRAPVSVLDRIYFTGMALFTLGTGDIVAATPGWRLVSVLASATGLFLVTLSLSYFISVVGAATSRRVLAVQLDALGKSPQEVVANAWTGTSFSPQFALTLSLLGEPIARYAEQHMSKHVLHYFHTQYSSRSVIVGLARLDEALTLLDAVAEGAGPDPYVRDQTRDYVTAVLEVVGQTYRSFPDTGVPSLPDTGIARARGIPLAEHDQVAATFEGLADRRRQMAAMVASDGWWWEEV